VFDVEAKKELSDIAAPGRFFVNRLLFSPDGSQIAAAPALQDPPFLWDWRTKETKILPAGAGSVKDIGYSADGRRLLTMMSGGNLSIWDLALYDVIDTGLFDNLAHSAAFGTNDGEVIVAGGTGLYRWALPSSSRGKREALEKYLCARYLSPDLDNLSVREFDGWSIPASIQNHLCSQPPWWQILLEKLLP
jgi:WD40 repeat protein